MAVPFSYRSMSKPELAGYLQISTYRLNQWITGLIDDWTKANDSRMEIIKGIDKAYILITPRQLHVIVDEYGASDDMLKDLST